MFNIEHLGTAIGWFFASKLCLPESVALNTESTATNCSVSMSYSFLSTADPRKNINWNEARSFGGGRCSFCECLLAIAMDRTAEVSSRSTRELLHLYQGQPQKSNCWCFLIVEWYEGRKHKILYNIIPAYTNTIKYIIPECMHQSSCKSLSPNLSIFATNLRKNNSWVLKSAQAMAPSQVH